MQTTAVVKDAESFTALWSQLGLEGDAPLVDFAGSVVFYFGAVESGSCPFEPLSGIVYDWANIRVYPALYTQDTGSGSCTDDANPRAIVVSVDRDALPEGEFHLWVWPEDFDSPDGVTFIAPGELTSSQDAPYPALGGSGRLDVGETRIAYEVSSHCGVEWLLRPVNGVVWRAVDLDETDAQGIDPVPGAWGQANDSLDLVLELVDEMTLRATALGTDVTVTYEPDPDPPGCG